MTTHQRILELFIRARRGDYVETVDNGRLRIPPGWLPLFTFQGKDAGGSAANMRLWELKAPEQARKNCKGIPIEKDTFEYQDSHGRHHALPVYRLAIEPAHIDRFLNPATCTLNKHAIAAAGYTLRETTDDGPNPSPCVQLVRQPSRPQQTNIFASI